MHHLAGGTSGGTFCRARVLYHHNQWLMRFVRFPTQEQVYRGLAGFDVHCVRHTHEWPKERCIVGIFVGYLCNACIRMNTRSIIHYSLCITPVWMYSVLPVYYDTRSPFLSLHWSYQSLYTRLHNGSGSPQGEKRGPGLAPILPSYSRPSAMSLYCIVKSAESAYFLLSRRESAAGKWCQIPPLGPGWCPEYAYLSREGWQDMPSWAGKFWRQRNCKSLILSSGNAGTVEFHSTTEGSESKFTWLLKRSHCTSYSKMSTTV